MFCSFVANFNQLIFAPEWGVIFSLFERTKVANDGKDYEQFVKDLQQGLLDSEDFIKQKNICIETNKMITDNR